jgi:hypothetical protein
VDVGILVVVVVNLVVLSVVIEDVNGLVEGVLGACVLTACQQKSFMRFINFPKIIKVK